MAALQSQVEVAATPRGQVEAAALREWQAAIADEVMGHGVHANSPALRTEHEAVMALVPLADATHRAILDGSWSDPNTWSDLAVPAAGSRVWIMPGRTVTVDGVFGAAMKTLRVDGTLKFAPNVDTALKVDTMVVAPGGTLEIGTAGAPIAAGRTATVTFADTGEIDRAWDPYGLSRGLISHGNVDIHGAGVTGHVELARAPRRGDTSLSLSSAPTNWRVGDRVVLTGVQYGQDELLTIRAISASAVTVDRPLAYDHVPPTSSNPAAAAPLSVDLADLERNVRFVSENSADVSRRGHFMAMHSDLVDVVGAGFYGMGRTDKSKPINDAVLDAAGRLVPGTGTNPRGRYAVHLHRLNDVPGVDPTIADCVVDGTPGWGIVNHSSRAYVDGNAVYNAYGAGFVTEAGDETGEFVGNIAIGSIGSPDVRDSRSPVQDFGFNGHGFWFTGPYVRVTDNVASGQKDAAYVYWSQGLVQGGVRTTMPSSRLADPSRAGAASSVAIENLPILQFSRNVAFASRDGLNTWFHNNQGGTIGRSVVEDSDFWNNNRSGVQTPYTRFVTLRNVRIIGVGEEGVKGNGTPEGMGYENLDIEGYKVGIQAPAYGTNWVKGGFFDTATGIVVPPLSAPLIRARSLAIDGVRFGAKAKTPISMYGVSNYGATSSVVDPSNLFAPDNVTLDGNRLFFAEQAAGYVLNFPSLPPELRGKTGRQILAATGRAIGGMLAPGVAPAARGDAATTAEDTAVAIDVASNDSDADGNLVAGSATILSGPSHGAVSVNATTGLVTYTPANDYNGPDSFTYRISDADGLSSTATVSLTVTPVNDAPVAKNDGATTAEDTAVVINVAANDADVDGNLNARGITVLTAPAHGTATADPATGLVTYTPSKDYNGPDSFTYRIGDADGLSSTATVNLTVTPVDDAPVAVYDAASTAEDTAVVINVAANDSDVDGDVNAKNVTVITAPAHGTATVDPTTGLVTYTPAKDYNGTDSFTYRVSDTDGLSSTATVSLTVTPVNDAPAARGDAATTAGGTPLAIPVLANDSDADGDPLAVASVSPPSHGAATLNGDGTIAYAPAAGYAGVDSFTYTISDGRGGAATATVTVEVAATPRGQVEAAALREWQAAIADEVMGHGVHANSPALRTEHEAVMALVPLADATHRAILDGSWSDPNTWSDLAVPAAGSRVWIMPGRTVTVDGVFGAAMKTLRVDGTLKFAPNVDTALKVDTMVVAPGGTLEIGTAGAPIAAGRTATVTFADTGEIDRAWDPYGLSRGLISHGNVDIHGAGVTGHVELARAPRRGDTSLSLSSAPTNWRVGDRVVLTGVQYGQDELLTIRAISASAVTVDRPLAYDHVPPTSSNPAAAAPLSVDLADLERNVRFVSENSADVSRRGHFMAMHSDLVDVVGAGFYGMGRTDKSKPINDAVLDAAGRLVPGTGTNPRGRYAVHLHRLNDVPGVDPTIADCVVDGTPGWGIVNHSSRAYVDGNAVYNAYGAGFVTEAGDETGEFVGNIAIGSIGSPDVRDSRSPVQDFGFNGHGFWFTGPYVRVTDNVASGQKDAAYVYWSQGLVQGGVRTTMPSSRLADPSRAGAASSVAIENLPILQFSRNVAFASRDGLNTWFHNNQGGTIGRSVVEDSDFWNNNRSGVQTPYTRFVTLRNVRIIGVGEEGVKGNGTPEGMGYENLDIEGYKVGIQAPAYGTNWVKGGFFDTATGIVVPPLSAPLIRARSLAIDGVRFGAKAKTPISMYGVSNYGATSSVVDPSNLFAPDNVTLDGNRLFFAEQAAGYVLNFPSLPPELRGKTGRQILAATGRAIGGMLAPGVAPAARGDAATTAGGTPLAIPVLANDSDADGDPLAVASVSPPSHGAATLNGDGTIAYAPAAGYAGVDSFTYTISDGRGGAATATVTVEVAATPRGQVEADLTPLAIAALAEETSRTLAVLAEDAPADSVSSEVVDGPTQMAASALPPGQRHEDSMLNLGAGGSLDVVGRRTAYKPGSSKAPAESMPIRFSTHHPRPITFSRRSPRRTEPPTPRSRWLRQSSASPHKGDLPRHPNLDLGASAPSGGAGS